MKKSLTHACFLLFSALCLMLFHACKKEDPQPKDCPPGLPCATQTGENTFGCYINGKPWVAGIAPYIFDPILHKISSGFDEVETGTDHNSFLNILASSVDSIRYDLVSFNFSPIIDTGKIIHTSQDLFDIKFNLDKINGVSKGIYHIDTSSEYEILITAINHDKNIVAGLFSMTAITIDKKDTISVTNGRFDVHYAPE